MASFGGRSKEGQAGWSVRRKKQGGDGQGRGRRGRMRIDVNNHKQFHRVLRLCSSLVFSQSLLSLDLIEMFLEHWDEEKDPDKRVSQRHGRLVLWNHSECHRKCVSPLTP